MTEQKLKKGFDFLSWFYDLLLFISSGKTIVNSQVSLIKKLPPCSNALLIGEGTGNFLKALAASDKARRIVYLDISSGMCQQAQNKLKTTKHKAEVEFRIGSFEQVYEDEVFDLVSTNYFLDVFTPQQLDVYIPLLASHLKQDGLWYCSDFYTPPKLRLKDYLFKPILAVLYLFFRLICRLPAHKLPPSFEKLTLYGLKEQNTEYFLSGFIKSSISIKR